VAGCEQGALLTLPRVPVERMPVDQHDRRAGAVVAVVDLDVGAVLGPDVDERHGGFLWFVVQEAVPLRPRGTAHPSDA
jgi:hypothetical protein